MGPNSFIKAHLTRPSSSRMSSQTILANHEQVNNHPSTCKKLDPQQIDHHSTHPCTKFLNLTQKKKYVYIYVKTQNYTSILN